MSYSPERRRRQEQLLWSAGFLAGTGTLTVNHGAPILEFKLTQRANALTRFLEPLDDIAHVDVTRLDYKGRMMRRVSFKGYALATLIQRLAPHLDDYRRAEWEQLNRVWMEHAKLAGLKQTFSAGYDDARWKAKK